MKKILLITLLFCSMLSFDSVKISESKAENSFIELISQIPNFETDWFDLFKADYFVSETGSDSNDGTAPWKAWQTLAKVNAEQAGLPDGSRIALKSGGEWTGTITVGKSNLTFKSYGTGAKPKIYGSEVITGWTLHSGNIYKKVLSDTINQLFINGERASLARYPKATYADGYADITTVNSTTQFISTQIASQAADYYKDATFVGRTNDYTLFRTNVSTSTGQTITIATAAGLGVNKGFFLTNKLEFITEAGEWMFDVATKTVYVWMPNSDSPANYEVRGSIYDYGVNMASKNYITVKNLEILHSSIYGIYVNQSDYVTIDNNSIINPVNTGIQTYWWSDYSIISNNYIYEPNECGIRTYTNINALITGNTIAGVGKLQNMNVLKTASASGWGVGINSQNANGSITDNRITDCGYNGITFGFGVYMIKNNYINGACQVLDDGGGIYTYNGFNYANPGAAGSEVTDNIVINVIGNDYGTNHTGYASFGIYLDNETHDVLIEDNLVATSTYGIYLHDGGFNTVNRNTIYDCSVGWYTNAERANSTVKNNKFYLTARQGSPGLWGGGLQPQRVVYETNGGSSTIDSNMYIVPYTESNVFWNFASWAAWKTDNGQDANSTYNGTDITANYSERVLYNETSVPKKFYRNNATNITLPFTGKSLLTDTLIAPNSWIVVQGLNTDAIQTYSDAVAPVITAFTIPATTNTFQITLTSLTSTGSTTAYNITETNVAPNLYDAGWVVNPTTYTFSSNGSKTLYAWARDAAGNISASVSDDIVVNVPYPITGHIAAWKMDETTGDNINDEIGTNDLTASGTTIVDGKLSKARSYNGTSDYSVGSNPSIWNDGLTNDFSVIVWFNATAFNNYGSVFFGGLNGNNNIGISADGSGRMTAIVKYSGTRIQKRVAAGELSTGVWYHAVITWDASERIMKYYINGVEKTTSTADSGLISAAGIWVGAASATTYRGNVIVDQLEIIDHILTTQEISDSYKDGNGLGYY